MMHCALFLYCSIPLHLAMSIRVLQKFSVHHSLGNAIFKLCLLVQCLSNPLWSLWIYCVHLSSCGKQGL